MNLIGRNEGRAGPLDEHIAIKQRTAVPIRSDIEMTGIDAFHFLPLPQFCCRFGVPPERSCCDDRRLDRITFRQSSDDSTPINPASLGCECPLIGGRLPQKYGVI